MTEAILIILFGATLWLVRHWERQTKKDLHEKH